MGSFILKYIILLSLGFVVANASSGYFIGVGSGINHSYIKEGNADVISDNNLGLSAKIGYIYDDNHRFSFAYKYNAKLTGDGSYDIKINGYDLGKAKSNYKFTSHNFLLGYDYTPQINSNLRALAGVFAGYSLGVLDVSNSLIKEVANAVPNILDGFSYGAKLGVIYEVDSNWDIELGGKIMQTIYNNKEIDLSFSHNGATYKIENEPLKLKQLDTGIYFGVNYKF